MWVSQPSIPEKIMRKNAKTIAKEAKENETRRPPMRTRKRERAGERERERETKERECRERETAKSRSLSPSPSLSEFSRRNDN